MGYHTYSLAQFDLRALGEHDLYIFFFSQDHDQTRRFSEDIGYGAVAISSSIEDADWRFMPCLPSGYTPHAIWYATIVVMCADRKAANAFLAAFRKTRPGGDSFAKFDQTCVIFVPNAVDKVVASIATYIRERQPGDLVLNGKIDIVCAELEAMLGFHCHQNGGAIFVHTRNLIEPPVITYPFDELMITLNCIRDDLNSIKENREAQDLLKQLKKLKRQIANAHQSGSGIKAELALGFDFFGSGAKLVYETNAISTDRLAKAKSLLKKLSPGWGRTVED